MRLQHGGSHALYRDPLQAAMVMLIVSGFRNAIQKSGFAKAVSSTIAPEASAVRMSDCGDYQSVDEHQDCSDYEQNTFHGCFLLVLKNRTVIFS